MLFAAQCVAPRNAIVPTAVQRQSPCLVRQEGRELVVDALVAAMVVVGAQVPKVSMRRHDAGSEDAGREEKRYHGIAGLLAGRSL